MLDDKISTEDIKNKVLFKDAMEKKIKNMNSNESDSDETDNDLENLSDLESE